MEPSNFIEILVLLTSTKTTPRMKILVKTETKTLRDTPDNETPRAVPAAGGCFASNTFINNVAKPTERAKWNTEFVAVYSETWATNTPERNPKTCPPTMLLTLATSREGIVTIMKMDAAKDEKISTCSICRAAVTMIVIINAVEALEMQTL